SYNKRLQYQTYDVTSLLRAGENVVGAILGDGWYRGNLGFDGQRNVYGKRLALRLQLEIRYRDGRVERVVSDTQWKTATGPILLSTSMAVRPTTRAASEQVGPAPVTTIVTGRRSSRSIPQAPNSWLPSPRPCAASASCGRLGSAGRATRRSSTWARTSRAGHGSR